MLGSLVMQEFTPDLLRLFRRYAPRKVQNLLQKIQEKIPPQILGIPPPNPDDQDPGQDQECTPNEKCPNSKEN